MPLHLRRNNLHPIRRDYPDDHYIVFNDEGCAVGTILYRSEVQGAYVWAWHINGEQVHGLVASSGIATSLQDAKAALADNWRTWLEENKLPENHRPKFSQHPMTAEQRVIWRMPPDSRSEP